MSRHVIIAGFHRSGTSMAAQIVQRAGLSLGERLLGPLSSNLLGHAEDLDFVEFHDELLRVNRQSWVVTAPFSITVSSDLQARVRTLIETRDSVHAAWGFKDPRATLFLGNWRSWLPDVHVLAVYRHPVAACESLIRRESKLVRRWWRRGNPGRAVVTNPQTAYSMWNTYNAALVDYAESQPDDVLVVRADSLRRGTRLTDQLRAWGYEAEVVDQASVFRSDQWHDEVADVVPAATAPIWERLNHLARHR